jgi:predicted enzyme related to lactoylglutathione lyase
VRRETMPRVIHFDLPADDPERAIRFYETVFGWQIRKWEGPMEYWLISTGPEDEPGIDGGLARRMAREGVSNTIGVPDLEEYVRRVVDAGGKVLMPKTAIPGVGWLATCEDTEGTQFGLMQADPNAQ